MDTDQWIKAIKKAGFKFALLTATHETGFALYPSDVNPYNVKTLKWKDGKGDIVRDFVILVENTKFNLEYTLGYDGILFLAYMI